jgi:hypothetical protein
MHSLFINHKTKCMGKKLALSFRKYNEPDLNAIAWDVTHAMAENGDFPDLQPLLPPIRETAEQFQVAMTAARLGDSLKIMIKNDLKEKLISLLRELGELVEKRSNGDDVLLVRSGFVLTKPLKEVTLQKPEDFIVLPGKINGQIILQIKRVKGAKAYMYQYTRDPLTDNSRWESITSTQRKIVISDLPLGVKFLFQVVVIGSRNQAAYSEILGRFIA